MKRLKKQGHNVKGNFQGRRIAATRQFIARGLLQISGSYPVFFYSNIKNIGLIEEGPLHLLPLPSFTCMKVRGNQNNKEQ